MFDITLLHNAIAAVCPIDGVYSTGSWSDKASWRIWPSSGATPAQISAAQTVLQNFDPNGPVATAQSTFEAALAAGVTLSWTVSTALNDTYPLDEATQIRMVAERLSVSVNSTFTNGATTLTWFGSTGTKHTMSMAQAGAFVKAVWQYLTALFVARATAAGGGTPTWPSANITITG